MKILSRIFFFVFIILSAVTLKTFSQALVRETITLEFDGLDSPPECLFPHRLLKHPRVGLALSGGGARALAQIGVLEVLEENNIPIDFIVGTSMGAVVGGLYAIGYTPSQIQSIVQNIKWNKIMVDTPPRTSLFPGQREERERSLLQLRFDGIKPVIPKAFTPGQNLTNILTELTMRANYRAGSNFDNFKIPFRAIATDLITGQKIVLKNGDLAEALKASVSVPLLFVPVSWQDRLLVDGGLVDNIPVDEARKGNVELVIAVDTISKLRKKGQLNTPWQIADQVTTIMQKERNESQRANADVLIKIDLPNRLSTDFSDLETVINAGKKEAQEKITDIKNMLNSHRTKSFSRQKYLITSVSIEGITTLNNNSHLQSCSNLAGKRLSPDDVEDILKKIYCSGSFRDVRAYLTKTEKDTNLVFQFTENPVLKKILIRGNTVFSDSTILAQISTKPGEVLNYYQGKQDLQAIINLYKNHGFDLARIKQVDFDEVSGTLEITLDEGKIWDIKVVGNQRTKDVVILREFPLNKGDIFNIRQTNRGIKNIHSTDLFSTVLFNVARKKDSLIVVIKVDEKKFTLLRFSSRYDLERRGRGVLELGDENILGLGAPLTFHAQYGPRDLLFQTQLRADRIFRTYLTYTLNLYYQRENQFTYSGGKRIGEYQQRRAGLRFSLGQQIKRLGTLSFVGKWDRIELRPMSGTGYPSETMTLSTLSVRSIVDTQDQIPFPTKGKNYLFFYEFSSAKFLSSQISFFKLYSSLETYRTFFKYHTIHPKFIWGTSDLTTPFSEQFRLGGESSFYGLHDYEFVGRHLLLTSLEYRFRLPWKLFFDLYLNLRYDFGAVWKNTVDIQPKDFRQGCGIGISLDTPLGPISFAYGWMNKKRKVGYFSAGYQF